MDAMESKLFDHFDLGLIKVEVQKEINVIEDITHSLSLEEISRRLRRINNEYVNY
jgi:hypothetical protein